jgi:hypothetical protein
MQLRLRGEIESAFRYTLAASIIFLFVFDVRDVYLDPLVTYNTSMYEMLVEALIIVAGVYIWAVAVGNAHNFVTSSQRPEGG